MSFLLPAYPLRQAVGALCLLALLALSAMLIRGGRERHILVWLCGWMFFVVGREFDYAFGLGVATRTLALTNFCYALGFALLLTAICEHAGRARERRVVIVLGALTMLAAVVPAPEPSPWRAALLQGAQWLMLIVAVAPVLRRARADRSLWVMSAAVVLMRLQDWPGYQPASLFAGGAFDAFFSLTAPWLALEAAQQRQRHLRALRQLGDVILETRELEAMLQRSLRIYREQSGVEAAFVLLLEDKGLRLHQQSGLGEMLNELRGAPLPLDSLHGLRQLCEGQPVRRSLERGRLFAGDEPLRAEGFRSALLLPLRERGRLLGVIALCSRARRDYTASEMRFWQASAAQTAAAVENLRILARLLDSQRQWAATFDSLGEMILVHDLDERVLRMNHAMISRIGPRRGGFYGKSCAEVLPHSGGSCPYCRRVKSRQLEGPDSCFGGVTAVATSAYDDAAGRGVVHVVQDVTRGREAERSYRVLFDSVQEGVFISTADGALVDCNEAFVRIFGYDSKDDLLALGAAALYLEPGQRAALLRRLRLQGFVRSFEFSCRRRDGSPVLLSETSFAVRDSQGALLRIQGLIVDITARRQQEEQMRRRNRDLHALNEIADALADSLDLDQILSQTLRRLVELARCDLGGVYVRDAQSLVFRRRAGAGYRTPQGRDCLAIELAPDDFADLCARQSEISANGDHEPDAAIDLALAAAEGASQTLVLYLWRQQQPVGLLRLGRRRDEPFGEYERELCLSVARQIASAIERVRLFEGASKAYEDLSRTQQQLLQSEKMSSMGRMISGVAHELNNPLTAILGYSQLLEGEPLGEQARDYVSKLWRQTQRTQKVVQNLLSFARQSKPTRTLLDLRSILDDTLALREYDLARHEVAVERRYAEGLPLVSGDANQLEQVFLNILNNALDAMLDAPSPRRLVVSAARSEHRVQVELHDSGAGLREPSRVFDPFYTTKPIGKGTGLGLSICYGIVKEHDGDIVAVNHADGGAVFRVELPCAKAPVERREPSVVAGRPLALDGRVLLVVPDDPQRDFLSAAIAGAGASVAAIAHVEEAMARLQREPFALIVVASSMPSVYTPEEILRLAGRCQGPSEPRLLLLLEASEQRPEWISPPPGVLSLRRPFGLAALLGELRLLLEEPVVDRA